MTTDSPTATISSSNRKLAGAILALIVLQFAFVAVGGAEVSEIGLDTSGTATVAAVAPTPSSDGTIEVGPGVSAPPSDADVQSPSELRFYNHPFLEGECFWFCMERNCPCIISFPFPQP